MPSYRCQRCGECFYGEAKNSTHAECGGEGQERYVLATEVYIWRD